MVLFASDARVFLIRYGYKYGKSKYLAGIVMDLAEIFEGHVHRRLFNNT